MEETPARRTPLACPLKRRCSRPKSRNFERCERVWKAIGCRRCASLSISTRLRCQRCGMRIFSMGRGQRPAKTPLSSAKSMRVACYHFRRRHRPRSPDLCWSASNHPSRAAELTRGSASADGLFPRPREARQVAMNRVGIAFALVSALLFGLSTPVAKLLLGTIDPWLLAGLLYARSGFGLMAILFVGHGRGAFASIARADIPWLAGAIAAGGVVGPVLLMFGLSSIQASTASLLLNVEGLATM